MVTLWYCCGIGQVDPAMPKDICMHSGYYLWPHHLSLPNHAEYLSLCMLCHVLDGTELALRGTFTGIHEHLSIHYSKYFKT
jgi:hypothetical protein